MARAGCQFSSFRVSAQMSHFNRFAMAGLVAFDSALTLAGCGSLLSESASAGADIAGGAIAGALTDNAGVAAGIGIGVQAIARAGLQYGQRKIHAEAQHRAGR